MNIRNRRWMAAGIIAFVLTGSVLAAILLVNGGISRETQQLILRLTLENSQRRQTAAPTAPPVATDTVIADSGNPGFTLRANLPDTPLVADGLSSVPMVIATTDSALIGRSLTLSVFGGGSIDPPQIVLPPLGQAVAARYTSGEAASSIRIDATVADSAGQRTASVQFISIHETPQITGEVTPLDNETGTTLVPFTLALINPDGAPLYGQYRVRVFPDGGQILDPSNNAQTAPLDFMLAGATPKTLFFIPNVSATSGSLQAQILGRSDIEPYRAAVRWNNLTARLDILRGSQPLNALSAANQVLSWSNTSEICVRTLNRLNQLISPNVLNFSYRVLITPQEPAAFASDGITLAAGQVYSTDDHRLPFAFNATATCLPVATLGNTGGLLAFSFWADRHEIQDQALALVQFGQVAVWQAPQPITLTLPRLDGGQAQLTFTAATAPALYWLDRQTHDTVLLTFWVAADAVDSTTGQLNAADSLTIIGDVTRNPTPLSVVNYGALQQVYVARNLAIPQGGVLYYRAFAAAHADPGVLPLPATGETSP